MSQLVNLKVTAVAFVQRGANRKTFFLTKSADHSQKLNQKRKGEEMNEVIRKELQTLMKSADHKDSSVEKLIEALKASEVVKKLELTDEDFTEITKDVELIKSLSAPADVKDVKKDGDTKKDGDVKDVKKDGNTDKDQIIIELQKSVGDLAKVLETQTENLRLSDIKQTLEKRAPYAPIDVEKEAKLILKLEKLDAEAAKSMIERFEQISTVMASSGAYNEIGSSADGDDSVMAEVATDVAKDLEALEKSDKGDTPDRIVASVTKLMKKKGAGYYDQYVSEHRQRARVS